MTTSGPEEQENTEPSESLRGIGRRMRDRRKHLGLKKATVVSMLRAQGVRVGTYSLGQYERGNRNFHIQFLLEVATLYESDLGIRRWFTLENEENFQWLLDDPLLSRAISRKLEEGFSQREILKQLRKSLNDLD